MLIIKLVIKDIKGEFYFSFRNYFINFLSYFSFEKVQILFKVVFSAVLSEAFIKLRIFFIENDIKIFIELFICSYKFPAI